MVVGSGVWDHQWNVPFFGYCIQRRRAWTIHSAGHSCIASDSSDVAITSRCSSFICFICPILLDGRGSPCAVSQQVFQVGVFDSRSDKVYFHDLSPVFLGFSLQTPLRIVQRWFHNFSANSLHCSPAFFVDFIPTHMGSHPLCHPSSGTAIILML